MTHNSALVIEKSKGVSVVEVLAPPRLMGDGMEIETSAGTLPIDTRQSFPAAALEVGSILLVSEGSIIA